MSRPASPALVATLGWLIGCACLVPPVEAADAPAQRARIASQRAAANAALAERERACQPQFLATRCVDAARKEQRDLLTRLRGEELALDEAQRREDAALRRQTLLDKAAARQARTDDADAAEPRRAASRSASTPPEAGSPRADSASQPRTRNGSAERARRAAFEEENKAKFETRARSAQAHRDAVEQRNAQREASGKRVAPLPVPARASAPALASPKPGSAP